MTDVLYHTGHSAGASLNEPPPRTTAMALNFLATFFSGHTPNNDRLLVVTVHKVHLYGPFTYVALSSLTLPLRQRTRPFTAIKALSGPLYPMIGPFYPSRPVRGFGGSAPVLAGHSTGHAVK